MKIIKILPRRGRILEVRFDDGTYINLDRAYAEPLDLKEGMTVTDQRATEWEDQSDIMRCKSRALFYLSGGDLSEKKLKAKLIKAGFEERFVGITLDRLKELSYIDDRSFALRYFEKCLNEGISVRQAVEKMVHAGISRQLAREVCTYSSQTERESIRRIIEKKYRNKLNDADSVKKTTAALVRRGFAFSDIRAVIAEFSDTLRELYEE